MLKNNLKDISNIVLLRSDKILNELLKDDLRNGVSRSSKSYEHGVRDFYPNTFRKGAIENSVRQTLSKNSSKEFSLEYDFDFLEDLFAAYFKFDGNHIYAKKESLGDYSSLINKIHPFNVMGYKLAKQLRANETSVQNVKEYAKHITPLGFNINRDFKEYAENHIHLGGSNTESLNFMAMLSNPTNKKFYDYEVLESLPRINEFSYVNNGDYSLGMLIDIAKYCVSFINSALLGANHSYNSLKSVRSLAKHGKGSMIDVDFCSFNVVDKIHLNSTSLIKSYLFHEAIKHKREGYLNKTWFLYNVSLFDLHLKKESDRATKRVVKIFLHTTNILRSYMLMSQNLGLSHFSEFFGSSLRKQEKNRFQNVASNIMANGTTKVEAKISPAAVFNDEMARYKLAFDKEIILRESSKIKKSFQKHFLNTNDSKRNYHFCVHFIREGEKAKKTGCGVGSYRFHKLRKKLKKEAHKLNDYLCKESNVISKFDFYRKFHEDKTKVLKYKQELENEYIDLSKLISAIDVAGDENRTPPEVFAPIIKYLRRDVKILDSFKEDYIKHRRDGHNFVENYNLRLSIHAGEDFNHIVTGMRKTHETVKFYHMQERDRLGHALAIGLNPKKWCEKNRDIFVSKQEHLDNLVWLYHQATEVSPYVEHTYKLKAKYEKKAIELFKEIYGDLEATMDDIYKAWKLREYCPLVMCGEYDYLTKTDEYIRVNSFEESKGASYKKAKKIHERYVRYETARERGDEVIKIVYDDINRNESFNHFVINDDDLDLIEAIQDRLIQKFCDKGLIIETNPSSNAYISHIDSYEEHPIYRWFPVEVSDLDFQGKNANRINRFGIRKSRMKVCVNTDDPAIMPTTLRNEFDLIETHARHHSESQEAIEKWSEDLRQIGIEIFDYDHSESEFLKI